MTTAVSNQQVKKRNTPPEETFYENQEMINILQRNKRLPVRKKQPPQELPPPPENKKNEFPAIPVLSGILAFLLFTLAMLNLEAIESLQGLMAPQNPQQDDLAVYTDTSFEAFMMEHLISEDVREPDSGPVGELEAHALNSLKVTQYTMKRGDNLEGMAKKFKLNMDTIISYNKIQLARRLKTGQQLAIPSIDGIKYRVRPGDTLSGIARKFRIPLNNLLDWNGIDSSLIMVGTEYFIPGARLSRNHVNRVLGRLFLFPTRGTLTSKFGLRNNPFTGAKNQRHNGIDLANAVGTSIKAAMDGKVIKVGYSNLYGKYVIIKHADGFQTLYAHLSKPLVKYGQYVYQGHKIGLMGNTGYSTGSHLHFGIFKNGTPVNPYNYF